MKTVTISFSLPDRERFRMLVRRRGTGLVLALIVEALILLMLLTFTPKIAGRRDQGSLMTFGIEADKAQEKQEKQQKTEKRRTKAAEKPKPQPPQPAPTPQGPIELPPSIVRMTRNDFAAGDISRFPHPAPQSSAAQDQGDDNAEPDSVAVGRAPNGQPLYPADWFRRPTDTELRTYIPARAHPPGYGLIACRTMPNYRVDDCQELGEGPTGSGLAGAVRQAAWQFRVIPPRLGGKAQVGAWVSIRIDYVEGGLRIR